MNFVAIDVETANPDMASICQIGLAKYENGTLSEEWTSYVDPKDRFAGINVSVHGINETVVKGAPTFAALSSNLFRFLQDTIVVSHTNFDRVALQKAVEQCGLEFPACLWLDSSMVVRRSWPEFSRSGYGLHSICKHLRYDFEHHDALADAKASAYVLLAAIEKTGIELEGWLDLARQPKCSNTGSLHRAAAPRRETDNRSILGEVVVFTGSLKLRRREAAELAVAMGWQVATSVTERTTVLVVGDQDIRRLAGEDKSSKHRKAEKLIARGAAIRILTEGDFMRLSELSNVIPL